MASEKETETPILHVIVVGFHHKKGCQVDKVIDHSMNFMWTNARF